MIFKLLDSIMALMSELTKILKGVQTETARALQQFRIKTSGDTRFKNVDLDETK